MSAKSATADKNCASSQVYSFIIISNTETEEQNVTSAFTFHAIEMCNGKPVWVKDKCTMSLGCLHRSPKFAIQYGASDRHGQYQHP